jgi:restriction system protein
MSERTFWGIHAGRRGEANSLFLQGNCVALGWDVMGDLSKIKGTREAFRAEAEKLYPGRKPGWYAVASGQVYRFVHEMKTSDFIIYPSKIDRQIHIGEITGQYEFHPERSHDFPHARPVKWLKHVPRTLFSQGALYETGSALTFFQIKNYASEFLVALETDKPAPLPVTQDESVSAVAEDIEDTTRDFVLKRLAQELKGHPFAEFVEHLLNTMGYRTRLSPEGPDGGVDIVAHRDELGFEPPIIRVQVKSSEGSTGDPVVSALYGKLAAGDHALLVTLGTFTAQAKAFERAKSNLRLIDGQQLVDLVLEHYDKFESRYQGLIPLRRVYVPQPLEPESE